MAEAMVEAVVAVVAVVEDVCALSRRWTSHGGAREQAMETARWPGRAGCYGGLCHAYGIFRRMVAGLSGAVASSGLS